VNNKHFHWHQPQRLTSITSDYAKQNRKRPNTPNQRKSIEATVETGNHTAKDNQKHTQSHDCNLLPITHTSQRPNHSQTLKEQNSNTDSTTIQQEGKSQ